MLMIASLCVSMLLMALALTVMTRTVGTALPQMIAALQGKSGLAPLPAWQRRPRVVHAKVSFSRSTLRAAA